MTQLTIPSGEAPKIGFSEQTNSSVSTALRFLWSLALSLIYSWWATGSFVFLHSVTFDLKLFFWPQNFDKIVFTFPGFVISNVSETFETASWKIDAVILPRPYLYQSSQLLLVCSQIKPAWVLSNFKKITKSWSYSSQLLFKSLC